MSNTPNGETVGSIDTDQEFPDEWDDLSPRLVPLLEQPGEWFQEPVGQYETTLGPLGDVVTLTPEAVVFYVTVRWDQYPKLEDWKDCQTILWPAEEVVAGNETKIVPSKTVAEEQDSPAVWIEKDDPNAHVHERVPFEQRVTTVEDLQSELTDIMNNTPDWEDLFDAVDDVAADIGLIDSPNQT